MSPRLSLSMTMAMNRSCRLLSSFMTTQTHLPGFNHCDLLSISHGFRYIFVRGLGSLWNRGIRILFGRLFRNMRILRVVLLVSIHYCRFLVRASSRRMLGFRRLLFCRICDILCILRIVRCRGLRSLLLRLFLGI